MNKSVLVAGFAITMLLGACAPDLLRQPSTATLDPSALQTNGDVDVRALNVTAYGFSHYRQLQADPAVAAETVAALDYLGGQLNTSPRWVIMPALYRLEMLKSRDTVRGLLGISPEVPSQEVVNTMVALAAAYRAGNQAQVQQLFASPIFSVPPAEAAERLANIPYLPAVNNAAGHAAAFAFGFSVT
jgi:hypothetical protein